MMMISVEMGMPTKGSNYSNSFDAPAHFVHIPDITNMVPGNIYNNFFSSFFCILSGGISEAMTLDRYQRL